MKLRALFSLLFTIVLHANIPQIKTTHPDGTTEQSVNNASGMPIKKIDENGNETSYGYDTSKTIPLLNTVTLPNNATTTYSYDSQNKKVAQADALSRTTSWNYTELGELREIRVR